MDIDWVREFCMSLPHATEKVQWEDDLVFKVGEKMFAVLALEPGDHWISFKCSPEEFAALVERPGIVPAPYLARAQWVALETAEALAREELRRLLAGAHALIFAKLPKRTQARLSSTPRGKAQAHRKNAPARRKPRKRTPRNARKRKKPN
ncbi:MAG TPA: MmcQ/YjbR family DNA-binding protein [Candidatus Aquilonibacter sp.]|nr:MmcQ/YjbR family DNA-binding protein [Candidatus Aquilonibacter sp.]